jgi:hypothetical protein
VAHPRMYEESNKVIKRLREICHAFPRVIEKEAWGECTFRVSGGKMFAMTDNNHHQSGHLAVWIMAPPTVQESLIRSAPKRFFKPPYVGAKGWVGVRLDEAADWDKLAAILRDGYLMSSPGKLARRKSPRPAKSTVRPKARINSAQPGTGPAKSRTARHPHR